MSTRNLTGRFLVLRSGSWSGCGLMLGSVRFFTECFQACWISQRKLWDRQLVQKFEEFQNECDNHENFGDAVKWHRSLYRTLFQSPRSKQASKQAFISYKGLLLSDRVLAGRQSHASSAIMTRENCCHEGSLFCREIQFCRDFAVFFAKNFFHCKKCIHAGSKGIERSEGVFRTPRK